MLTDFYQTLSNAFLNFPMLQCFIGLNRNPFAQFPRQPKKNYNFLIHFS